MRYQKRFTSAAYCKQSGVLSACVPLCVAGVDDPFDPLQTVDATQPDGDAAPPPAGRLGEALTGPDAAGPSSSQVRGESGPPGSVAMTGATGMLASALGFVRACTSESRHDLVSF